jgi:hypothetical protein
MVTFVSLFLWLIVGNHPVQVAVDPSVKSVEIFLDGRSMGVATEPEWEIECDFGPTLRPHKLVAVARDGADRELGRSIQLVNLPRGDAEVEIVFEGGTLETPTMLRVIAESAVRLEPLAVFATFDGLMLGKGPDGLFELPAYDPRQTHIVSAEAHFPEGVTARQDLTFGGTYGGRVVTELTAVPVFVDDGRELAAHELEGLLRVRGEAAAVAAVDRQGARVYMVRDHGTWPSLRRAGRVMDRRDITSRGLFRKDLARASMETGLVEEIPPENARFYLVVPNPTESRGLALFPVLHPFDIDRWGMAWLSSHMFSSRAAVRDQRLSEAVALAGLRAAADGCPRAVVLVLGEDVIDAMGYSPDAVREYLRALRVPLVVWSTARKGRPGSWGSSETVTGVSSLEQASRRLLEGLRRQWIVWVEGRYLPYEIELADNDKGIKLAG